MLKKSIYNSYINISESQGLIFCASSDEFVVLTSEMLTAVKNKSPEEIASLYPTLYKQLCTTRAYVDTSVSEEEELAERIREIDNRDDVFRLNINPTLDCNFNCWYCYENHVVGSKMDSKTIESVKRLITNIYGRDKIKQVIISFFGGEPLMQFDKVVKPIICHVIREAEQTNKTFSIGFTTNSYLLTDEMISYLKDKNVSFQITLDGGRKYHNKTRYTRSGKGSYDKILGNIKKLTENEISVNMRINYTHENLQSVKNIINDASDFSESQKKFINVDLQKVWQEADDSDENRAELVRLIKLFQSGGFLVTSAVPHNHVYGSCYGDKRNHLVVNYNGDIFLCTARDFSPESRAGYLSGEGEPVWENDALEKRMSCKFIKPVCKKCRIAPVCGGGCRQQALEHLNEEGCQYHYTEADIDKRILDTFEYRFILKAGSIY